MKKHILIISAVFPPEQVTSAFLNYDLAHELAKKYDVTVLTPYPTRPIGAKFENPELEGEPFKTVIINSYTYPKSNIIGRFRESVDMGRKCAHWIREHHNDIDFIYDTPWQLFGVAIVASTAKRYNIPYLVVVQDIYPESILTQGNKPKIIQRLVMGLLKPIDVYYQRNAKIVRTISDEMADYLSTTRKLPREKYLVVNNWQNDEDFQGYSNDIPTDKMRFIFVGSINLHSNVNLIIKSFAEAEITNSELIIYGGGNRKDYCVDLVKRMGLDNVKFDYVRRDQIAQVQSEASVLVLALPSGNGNLCLPSKLTSYMLSGKPILASVDKDSATSRYIKDANCGLSVQPDSISSLADGFRKMANMTREQLQFYADNSRRFAKQFLSRDVNLSLVCKAIDDIIERPK